MQATIQARNDRRYGRKIINSCTILPGTLPVQTMTRVSTPTASANPLAVPTLTASCTQGAERGSSAESLSA